MIEVHDLRRVEAPGARDELREARGIALAPSRRVVGARIDLRQHEVRVDRDVEVRGIAGGSARECLEGAPGVAQLLLGVREAQLDVGGARLERAAALERALRVGPAAVLAVHPADEGPGDGIARLCRFGAREARDRARGIAEVGLGACEAGPERGLRGQHRDGLREHVARFRGAAGLPQQHREVLVGRGERGLERHGVPEGGDGALGIPAQVQLSGLFQAGAGIVGHGGILPA